VQRSTANHRVQAIDDAFNADRSNSGAELQVIANVNRRASIIAEMRRTATIAADMIADKMALNWKGEEESRPVQTQRNFPPRQLHLPCCLPIQDESSVAILTHSKSFHQRSWVSK
jgi:hypothetical protein